MYDFEIRAVNSVGAGDAANTDGITDTEPRTPGPTGPTAVPILRTTLGTHTGTVEGHQTNATITVSWDALGPTVNGGDPITDYELCYKKSTDSAWMRWVEAEPAFGDPTAVGGGALWSAVHGSATGFIDPGTTYQYRARALNSVATAGTAATCTHWDGAWSAVTSATSATTPVVAPSAPTLHPVGGSVGPPVQAAWDRNVNSITIRWTPPANTGGADITGYEVWVGTAEVTDATTISGPTVTNLPPSRSEYISVGLTASTTEAMRTYYYRVRARNGSGASRVGAWSTQQAGTTTVSQTGTPGQPDIISANHSGGNVPVIWTAPADQGTSPITKYEVQYQRTDDTDDDAADLADWTDAAIGTPSPPTALTWTHMQAPGDSMFVYRVRAVNGSGAGGWSANSSTVDVTARVADAPMLTATAVGDDEIMLQWTIPEDNGTDITGFAIQQWNPDPDNNPATTEGEWTTTSLLPDASTVSNPTTNTPALTVFAVSPLDSGTTYYFRIQALPGGTWSTADDTMVGAASATTVAGTPSMATITTATPGTGDDADSITLVWAAPNSGGSDITGYQLRVWDGSNWMPLASPAASATTYKHDNLAPGTRYYYTLAARNSMGLGPWSDAMSAMTEAGNPNAPTLNAIATGATSIQLTWTVPDSNGATITAYELQRSDPHHR